MKGEYTINRKKLIVFSIFVFIFLVCASGSYASMSVYLSDQGTDVKDGSGTILASGDLSVRIYDAVTGGNLIFEQNFSGGIVDGKWNVMLNKSLNLSLNRKYWKDYYINGDDLDFAGQERLAFYSPLGDILYENYNANLTVNGSIGVNTSTLTHALSVGGDVNATGYYYGDGSQLTGISSGTNLSQITTNIANKSINMSGNSLLSVSNLSGDGDNLVIGRTGADTHSLTSADDLYIKGKCEVDGNSYFDSTAYFYNSPQISSSTASSLFFSEGGLARGNFKADFSFDSFFLALTSHIGRQFMIVDYDYSTRDFDHVSQTNPTLYIQSVTDPNTDNTQWVSFTHNKSNSVIESGNGTVAILGDGLDVYGNLTVQNFVIQNQTTSCAGDCTRGELDFNSTGGCICVSTDTWKPFDFT